MGVYQPSCTPEVPLSYANLRLLMPSKESVELPKGKGVFNFMWRCKECKVS